MSPVNDILCVCVGDKETDRCVFSLPEMLSCVHEREFKKKKKKKLTPLFSMCVFLQMSTSQSWDSSSP